MWSFNERKVQICNFQLYNAWGSPSNDWHYCVHIVRCQHFHRYEKPRKVQSVYTSFNASFVHYQLSCLSGQFHPLKEVRSETDSPNRSLLDVHFSLWSCNLRLHGLRPWSLSDAYLSHCLFLKYNWRNFLDPRSRDLYWFCNWDYWHQLSLLEHNHRSFGTLRHG